jgi:hypothetical protein
MVDPLNMALDEARGALSDLGGAHARVLHGEMRALELAVASAPADAAREVLARLGARASALRDEALRVLAARRFARDAVEAMID